MARSTNWLAVNPKHPLKTAKDFIDYAKCEFSKLNYGYGTAVPGSMFQQLTGARFTFVPYKAHTAMVTALMSGEIDVSITELQAYLSGNGLDNYLVTGAEAPRQVGEDFKRWENITRDAGVVPN